MSRIFGDDISVDVDLFHRYLVHAGFLYYESAAAVIAGGVERRDNIEGQGRKLGAFLGNGDLIEGYRCLIGIGKAVDLSDDPFAFAEGSEDAELVRVVLAVDAYGNFVLAYRLGRKERRYNIEYEALSRRFGRFAVGEEVR